MIVRTWLGLCVPLAAMLGSLIALPAVAAVAATQVSAGDTAWVLTSSALVLLMTAPGLALFYAGMVRRKNVLATSMHSFILAALISVQWSLYGYSLAFSPWHSLIGGLQWAGLNGVSATEAYASYSATIPHQAYMVFQCMFAVITRH
jgi:ammonium transporter, Amt family